MRGQIEGHHDGPNNHQIFLLANYRLEKKALEKVQEAITRDAKSKRLVLISVEHRKILREARELLIRAWRGGRMRTTVEAVISVMSKHFGK